MSPLKNSKSVKMLKHDGKPKVVKQKKKRAENMKQYASRRLKEMRSGHE